MQRGRLADALEHTQAAVGLQGSIDITAHVEDLQRISRILAIQGDLAGSRRNLQEALGVAEKIGARAQVAQSHMALAELDLEEGRAANTEQPIRDALPVFAEEKMRDDDLNGHVLLSRCLLLQGKTTEARTVLNQVRTAVAGNQNPANRLLFKIAEARANTADNDGSKAASRARARTELAEFMVMARNLGFALLEYESRLAAAEIESKENPHSDGSLLASLEKDAQQRGLGSIARKAADLRRGGSPLARSKK